MFSIFAAIVVLGVLIVVHEFGHFLVAKRLGVRVLRFSVGFGPALFRRTFGETEYALCAVPLGGYVKMLGEDPSEAPDEVDLSRSFSVQPMWKRAAIVVAGPGFNILFAWLAFAAVFAAFGAREPAREARVGGLTEGMPAAQAGLTPGDLVVAVDGKPVETWEELAETIRASGGRPLRLDVKRNGEELKVQVTPVSRPRKNLFGEEQGDVYLIGIERAFVTRPVGPLEAMVLGGRQTLWWTRTLLVSIVKLVQGVIPREEIGGPILIVQAAGQQARVGLENLLHFMAVISINLGILNLLPIPVLDGGHLFFFGVEAVMRRPLSVRHREIAQQIGLAILIGVMAFAFYNDILRVLRGWG